MPLTAGRRLGPYEILAPLGAGGMGEVYRARDTRLGREVALKVLPDDLAADPDRLRRFEQEAKAVSALNHPNILTVFDVGADEGSPYLVTELLSGQTLRERLGGQPLPVRKAIEYGAQIARGLAAAHEKGYVHRDLKPENLFVTGDGHLKILDFGLAKLTRGPASEASATATFAAETSPGMVVGTLGYMSPEQVEGRPADHRSDVFSFGAVLYESISGRRAFRKDTRAETLAAIVREDPPELTAGGGAPVPPGLERIVRRCLEKAPEERFQSARDLAFALEALSGSGTSEARPGAAAGRHSRTRRLLGGALALAALALGYVAGDRLREPEVPNWSRVTFRRGSLWSARFADPQTIVYGAAWDGQPIRIFSARVGSAESRALDLPDADVLAVSSLGEMALSLGRTNVPLVGSLGTLARAPFAGGAPRQVQERVAGADWSPDGRELAVVRRAQGKWRLEYPFGQLLLESESPILLPRVSRDGALVAFSEANPDRLSIVDRKGKKTTLSQDGRWYGPAWSPRGDEIWFMSVDPDGRAALRAVTLAGKERLLLRIPTAAHLLDVSTEGRALVSVGEWRRGIMGAAPGGTGERELSWLALSSAADLSRDGRTLLFSERGEGAGSTNATYMRRTDGSDSAVRLGDGMPLALSPDAQWAVCLRRDGDLELLPTGAGQSRVLKAGDLEYDFVSFFPDQSQLLATARKAGGPWRTYALDLRGGTPRPVTPEGVEAWAAAPDGRWLAAIDEQSGLLWLHSTGGAPPRPVPGEPERGEVARFSTDGRWLFVVETEPTKARIFRREIQSGRRELWKDIRPADPAGLVGVRPVVVSADGSAYAYSYNRWLFTLYVVEGLK